MRGFLLTVVAPTLLLGWLASLLDYSGDGYWILAAIGAGIGLKFGLIVWVGWHVCAAWAEEGCR
jgi:hypothetical protein